MAKSLHRLGVVARNGKVFTWIGVAAHANRLFKFQRLIDLYLKIYIFSQALEMP